MSPPGGQMVALYRRLFLPASCSEMRPFLGSLDTHFVLIVSAPRTNVERDHLHHLHWIGDYPGVKSLTLARPGKCISEERVETAGGLADLRTVHATRRRGLGEPPHP